MASIADLYVTVMPETSKIADGIVRAFREVDPKATEAGRRWGREIQRGIDNVKVEFTADTAKAQAQIDEAAKDKKATVEVDADTAKAEAQIDVAARDRKATIEVDSDALVASATRSFGQLAPQMSQSLAGAGAQAAPQVGGSLSSAMGPVGTALSTSLIAGGLAAVAGIASALSGLAGLAPAGLAGVGSVVATLAVGLDGVKDAWDAVGKAAESSGKDQEEKTKAVASAQRSLKDAVLDEANAQKDVANARRDARQQLEDLNVQMRGGAIDEKQAILDAQAARRDLATGRFRDSIEYQQAQLRVEQADQRVLESHERNVHLQTQATDANAKGVEGSDQVVAANQRLAKAHESVATAQSNLAEAQSKTSSAADSAAQALAKLSPAAAAFVGTLVQMKPLWESFKNSVQDALFKDMGPQIRQLATTYMPILQGAFTKLAGLINQGASALMRFLEQPATMSMIQGLLTNLNSSFQQFLPVMQTFGQAFLQMTATGAAFLPQLGQIVGQMATMFAGFVNSGQFGTWMETGLMALQQLTNMLPTVLRMFTDLAPIGIAALGGLGQILTALEPAIAPLANLLTVGINNITPFLTLLTQLASTVMTALAPAMMQWYQAMTPVVQQIVSALQPVLATLGPVLARTAQVLIGAMIPAVQQLIPVIIPMVQQVALWYQAMLPLLPSLMQLATTAIPALTQILTTLLPIITRIMQVFTTMATQVIPPLSTAISTFASAWTAAWDKVGSDIDHVWRGVIKPIFDAIKNAIHDLGIDKLLSGLGGLLPNLHLPSIAPAGGAGGGAPGGFDWDAVAKAEASGNWSNADSGHNGHFGGLQFSPDTWKAFGGLEFADRPDHATREQQIEVANRTAFTGYKGTPPQGLGAWETITKGMVPGITTSSVPQGQGLGGYWATNPGAPTQQAPPGTWFAKPPTVRPSIPGAATTLPAPAGGRSVLAESGLQPNALQGGRLIEQLFPQVASIGGVRQDSLPDHPSGHALDIMIPNWESEQGQALGTQIDQYLRTHAKELGVKYTIFNMQYNPTGGQSSPYDYKGNDPNQQHRTHVHVTFNDDPTNAAGLPSLGIPTAAAPQGVTPNGIPIGSQQSPMYVMPAQSGAQQFGQDFLGGFLEIFGLDGSVFKNPLGSGLFKGFKGIMSMLTGGGRGGGYPASAFGGDGASLPLLGGGGSSPLGGLGGLLSGFMPAATAPGADVKQVGGGSTFHIQQQGMFLDQPQATDQIRQAAYTGTAWHNSMTSPAIMA